MGAVLRLCGQNVQVLRVERNGYFAWGCFPKKAGVELIAADDAKGPGVRFKESARTKIKRGRRKSD